MMIVSEIEALQPLVPIVRHHHERFDGKGYPDGLAGERSRWRRASSAWWTRLTR